MTEAGIDNTALETAAARTMRRTCVARIGISWRVWAASDLGRRGCVRAARAQYCAVPNDRKDPSERVPYAVCLCVGLGGLFSGVTGPLLSTFVPPLVQSA